MSDIEIVGMGLIKMSVYLDNGLVFEYNVGSPEAAREHADAIVKTGYRRVVNTKGGDRGLLEVYPPHRIFKVKAWGPGITTSYPDKVRGT